MHRTTRDLLDHYFESPLENRRRVRLEKAILETPAQRIQDVLDVAEYVQTRFGPHDIEHSVRVPAEFWQPVLSRLSDSERTYSNSQIALRVLKILKKLVQRRGYCLLPYVPRVLSAIRRSDAYLSRGKVSRPISLNMLRLLHQTHEHPRADFGIKQKVRPLMEYVRRERQLGARL